MSIRGALESAIVQPLQMLVVIIKGIVLSIVGAFALLVYRLKFGYGIDRWRNEYDNSY